MFNLTKHEEALLLSVLHLKQEAYGVHIRKYLSEVTGKEINYGTMYRQLDQLVRKGFLDRKEGDPLPEPGGRRKNYYSLTRAGLEALRTAQILQNALWGPVRDMAIEGKSS